MLYLQITITAFVVLMISGFFIRITEPAKYMSKPKLYFFGLPLALVFWLSLVMLISAPLMWLWSL